MQINRLHKELYGYISRQAQNIFITFVQRRPNVFDAGPTLYKCYKNDLCFLGLPPLSYLNNEVMAWMKE